MGATPLVSSVPVSPQNNYYGSGGYYDQARYVGRGRVVYSGNSVRLVCDFRRDGRLGYGETIEVRPIAGRRAGLDQGLTPNRRVMWICF